MFYFNNVTHSHYEVNRETLRNNIAINKNNADPFINNNYGLHYRTTQIDTILDPVYYCLLYNNYILIKKPYR